MMVQSDGATTRCWRELYLSIIECHKKPNSPTKPIIGSVDIIPNHIIHMETLLSKISHITL